MSMQQPSVRMSTGPRPAVPRGIVGTWTNEDLHLYLDRCQVDTPDRLVQATWNHILERRDKVGSVVDFGAGDGRFAHHGRYESYVGYEIDKDRSRNAKLPANAKLVHRCAFSRDVTDASVCIGNPPFVRNQDLPLGWRTEVASKLHKRAGISISGLANAWQYFFLLSIVSAAEDGLVALVIPYEWVSRPSAALLRDFIHAQGWEVDVYRLVDAAFDSVLTTASITIVDKAAKTGTWRYFEENSDGSYRPLNSASGSSLGYLPYESGRKVCNETPRAIRGLSPGTQKVFTLTEAERCRFGLRIEEDVVPCVTSLRGVGASGEILDEVTFNRLFRQEGRRCWLIRADREPSRQLSDYLQSVPESDYQTVTCLQRDSWWKFKMPSVPEILIATSFKGGAPKFALNRIRARAVGGVAGIHHLSPSQESAFSYAIAELDIRDRIVAHANGLRKIEINQLNALLTGIVASAEQ
ncbi:hypothetical protein QE385_002862 [Sphingomonas sp. SORGH_AS 950]|uniref:Eco57I restriction-modification methylase domain-containing protein n=1 Tax=Sphingomonas sp. SORGH_AS_0950 TaxID=3041792 RepID=UPI0027810EB7|nr:hypothetical protein [Sphingomonas sp. SORGH_AS_0950]MDQ1158535.1 hypothetical protein [Sphingomonas sp. SORGH_AS_0950]